MGLGSGKLYLISFTFFRSLPPRRQAQSFYGVSLKLQLQGCQNLPNGRMKVVVNHQRNGQQKWFMFPTWMWSRRASKARCQRLWRQLHQEMLQSWEGMAAPAVGDFTLHALRQRVPTCILKDARRAKRSLEEMVSGFKSSYSHSFSRDVCFVFWHKLITYVYQLGCRAASCSLDKQNAMGNAPECKISGFNTCHNFLKDLATSARRWKTREGNAGESNSN